MSATEPKVESKSQEVDSSIPTITVNEIDVSELAALVTGPRGNLFFNNNTLTDHDIPLEQLTWHTSNSSFPEHRTIVLELDRWRLYRGLISGARAPVVISHNTTVEQGLQKIVRGIGALRRCSLCTQIHVKDEMNGDRCTACILVGLVNTKLETCSICQEDSKHYIKTLCGHYFHPRCLIDAKASWVSGSEDRCEEDDEFPCPNCRTGLPDRS